MSYRATEVLIHTCDYALKRHIFLANNNYTNCMMSFIFQINVTTDYVRFSIDEASVVSTKTIIINEIMLFMFGNEKPI